jgi:hypothetical protein
VLSRVNTLFGIADVDGVAWLLAIVARFPRLDRCEKSGISKLCNGGKRRLWFAEFQGGFFFEESFADFLKVEFT